MAGLHQVSVSFFPVEDRAQLIVTSVAGEEFRFWMTRRFVRGLWQVILQLLASFPDLRRDLTEDVRQALLSMRHQEAVQDSDFDTAFKATGNPPPAPADVPLLIGVSGKLAEKGTVSLILRTANKATVSLGLDEKLLHALSHLLVEISLRAQWDLDLRIGEANVVLPEKGSHQLH